MHLEAIVSKSATFIIYVVKDYHLASKQYCQYLNAKYFLGFKIYIYTHITRFEAQKEQLSLRSCRRTCPHLGGFLTFGISSSVLQKLRWRLLPWQQHSRALTSSISSPVGVEAFHGPRSLSWMMSLESAVVLNAEPTNEQQTLMRFSPSWEAAGWRASPTTITHVRPCIRLNPSKPPKLLGFKFRNVHPVTFANTSSMHLFLMSLITDSIVQS